MRSITGTDAAEDAATDVLLLDTAVGGDLELFMDSADAPPVCWLCVAWPLEFSHMFSSKMLSEKSGRTARQGKRFCKTNILLYFLDLDCHSCGELEKIYVVLGCFF